MDFNEKLLELRKNKGLTQEELAEALYVSRTAVSKWESGRGYPNIESLKEISKFFSITIDDLLSGEKLLLIAEKENKSNIRNMCDLLFGIMDLFSFILIVLPLYPNKIDSYIYAVNLLEYTEIASLNKTIYWIMFISLIVVGLVQVILTKRRAEKSNKFVVSFSVGLNIVMVLFLAITRESYAVIVAFLLLIIKGILLLKRERTGD